MLLLNAPKRKLPVEGYITIEGYSHILDKIHHMILGATQRIYFSGSEQFIEKWEKEIREVLERDVKVVLLSEKLSEKGFSVSDEVCERFAELGLLNDEEYARAFVHDAAVVSGKGERIIKSELKRKGVADSIINNLMEDIQKNLYQRAKTRRDAMTYHVKTLEEIEKIMNTQPGFIYAPWCGNEECELKMKEIKGLKSRCIIEDESVTGNCVCCGNTAKHRIFFGKQY